MSRYVTTINSSVKSTEIFNFIIMIEYACVQHNNKTT